MTSSRAIRRLLLIGLLLPVVSGCAAFRPVHGVPARYVPDEYRGLSRSGKRTIDLSLLRQTPPVAHRVDSGDLLSIYIEGVLGRSAEPLPVYFPQHDEAPPSVGYPIPVRDDGTISLPFVGALPVRGMTLVEVEDRIRKAYTVDQQVLNPGRDRMIVALQRPRLYRITVIRQEASSEVTASGGTLNLGMLKRGTGKVVTLPIYRNDVLNALAETGGLPGLDAENAIYVIRNGSRAAAPPTWMPPVPQPMPSPIVPGLIPAVMSRETIRGQSPGWTTPVPPSAAVQPLPGSIGQPPASPIAPGFTSPHSVAPVAPSQEWTPPVPPSPMPPNATFMPPSPAPPPGAPVAPPAWSPVPPVPMVPAELGESLDGRHIIRIPVRLGPGEFTDIRESDIILHDGDIVFIESRDTEVFYTGGLLGGGQYSLPRDYDLDVLGAIAIAQGRAAGGGATGATASVGGPSALNNDVSISASHVIIIRSLPDGTQLPIKVDLYAALRDPAERIIIQPGDYVMLQYTCPEAVLAFVERHLLAGALFGLAAAQLQTGGN